MKHICIAIFVLTIVVSGHAQTVTDPISDFLNNLATTSDDKLLKLETDLNHDGKKQVFLSLTHHNTGKQGNVWTVYIPSGSGYLRLDQTGSGDTIVFNSNLYAIGTVTGLQGDALLAYYPGGSGKGVLAGYQVVNNVVREVTINQEFAPQGADAATYKRLFQDTSPPAIQIINLPQ